MAARAVTTVVPFPAGRIVRRPGERPGEATSAVTVDVDESAVTADVDESTVTADVDESAVTADVDEKPPRRKPPKLGKAARARRDAEIVASVTRDGASISGTARNYGLSTKSIYYILNRDMPAWRESDGVKKTPARNRAVPNAGPWMEKKPTGAQRDYLTRTLTKMGLLDTSEIKANLLQSIAWASREGGINGAFAKSLEDTASVRPQVKDWNRGDYANLVRALKLAPEWLEWADEEKQMVLIPTTGELVQFVPVVEDLLEQTGLEPSPLGARAAWRTVAWCASRGFYRIRYTDSILESYNEGIEWPADYDYQDKSNLILALIESADWREYLITEHGLELRPQGHVAVARGGPADGA